PGARRIEHLLRPTRAAARDAQGTDLQQLVEVAHPTRRFDLYARGRVAAHENQVFVRRPAGSVAGRGLYPVGPQLAADLAEADLVGILQVAVLEDDFDLLP